MIRINTTKITKFVPVWAYGVSQGTEHKVASGGNEEIIKEDWSEKLADLAIENAQFYAMTKKAKGGSQSTGNRKFNWPEYDEDDPKISFPAGGTNADNKVSLDPGVDLHGITKDTILLDKNGVYYRVTDNPALNAGGTAMDIPLIKIKTSDAVDGFSSSEETATKATLDAGMGSGASLYALYVNKEEGNDDINPVQRIIDNTYNFVGTFEDYTKITKTREHEQTRIGTSLRNFNIGKLGIKHANDIERAMWIGKGYNNNTNRQATKGFLNFSNIQTMSVALSSVTYLDIVTYAETKTRKKSKKKEISGYCNPAFFTALVRILTASGANLYLQYDAFGSKNQFGLNVKRLVTPHVVYNLIECDALKEIFGQAPIMCNVDMDKVAVRHLEGCDTELQKGVQPKSSNNYLDKIYTIGGGLQLESAQCHSVLKLTA